MPIVRPSADRRSNNSELSGTCRETGDAALTGQTGASYGVRGRDIFRRYKRLLNLLAGFYRLFPVKSRKKLLERHRYTRGMLGMAIRYALIKTVSPQCGDNVSIHSGVFLLNPQNISFGNNVSIHPMCYLEGGGREGFGIFIGDDVSIAHGTSIISNTHNYNDTSVCIKDQGTTSGTVRISRNVWIGSKATILTGVTVASGCVIGAGAVVTKDTEENGVYVGVPAKRIKDR